MVVSRRTSAAVRSWFDGISERPGVFSTGTMTEAASASPNNTSPVPRVICDFSTPQPIVALPCGSMSISSTRRRVAANEAARFTAVVVLPTPPFWFATAMMRFMARILDHALPERGCDFETAVLRVAGRVQVERRGICLHSQRAPVGLDLEEAQVAETALVEQLEIREHLVHHVARVAAAREMARARSADVP